MSAKSFRLLHAANLQLDCPLRGAGLQNDEIRDILDAATLTAFERIVTIAIEKDVDGVLITGNTFDASFASLAAEVAMREGFSRLADHNIPVFITPGEMDPDAAWLDLPRLPDNVTLFTDVTDPPVDLTSHGHLLATLFPVTATTSIEPEELANILGGRTTSKGNRPFVVGMLLSGSAGGPKDARKSKQNRFAALDWVVCHEGTNADSLPLTDGHAHMQSAPQGLDRSETGARGVTLLEVDSARKTKLTKIPVAPVRWETIVQPIDHVKDREALLERMLGQLERLPNFHGELVRIIDWKLDRTSGEANGWESDTAAKELGEALTELSDQPDGLRYVHRVSALEPDLTLIEPAHREVLTEYLLALERRAPSKQADFAKWIAEARVGDLVNSGRWEQWSESLQPQQVTERAQQLGWKWFATIGKK
ncbi:metallophosphoesterase family protein [Schlesneria paludicola]|uniref:metallophosphoesterase family protein n=1 Tax=Schlesneria paludicola TaxID=360056 RepID=UPI000299CEBA|nr:DNA repair exonuclease-like protein [Schlesneria paludicola]